MNKLNSSKDCEATAKLGKIPAELTQLSTHLTNLENCIDQLYNRLNSAVRDEIVAQKTVFSDQKDSSVPIVGTIRVEIQKIEEMTNKADSLLSRLEL